jgi:hypothetical protein
MKLRSNSALAIQRACLAIRMMWLLTVMPFIIAAKRCLTSSQIAHVMLGTHEHVSIIQGTMGLFKQIQSVDVIESPIRQLYNS